MDQPTVRAASPQPSAALTHAPTPLVRGGRAVVRWAQRFLYRRVMDVRLVGGEHVPAAGGFLVAANHASHLDAGLVKWALGPRGEQMRALAASDYFFAQPWSRWYFENLTNVLPIERHGNFRGSLKRAIGVLRGGEPLLVFPEGTRSVTGRVAPFKPAVSMMASMARCDILPVYLSGTFEALPKGGGMWPRVRRIGATVGPVIPAAFLAAWTQGLAKHDAYRHATALVELAVRRLAAGEALSPEALRRRYEAASPGWQHSVAGAQPGPFDTDDGVGHRAALAAAALRPQASNQDGGPGPLRGIA